MNEEGTFVTSNSLKEIPEKYRNLATCTKARKKSKKSLYQQSNSKQKPSNHSHSSSKSLRSKKRPASPKEVGLSRVSREKNLRTTLGNLNLRWDAAAEKYFGAALERTVISAINASARVLAQGSFPSEVRNNEYNWQIVIMDTVPVQNDISVNGANACHPGWMRFPSHIFIAGKRIATNCGREKLSLTEATNRLSETMVHEIGHAIEYQFLGSNYRNGHRWHREGFATWFESLASNYLTGRGNNKRVMRDRVKKSWDDSWSPQGFSGSWKEYARAYAIISTIADKRTISRLKDVYKLSSDKQIPVINAIKEELNWDRKNLYKNVKHNFDVP